MELKNLLNVVLEGLEVAYGAENIKSDGQEKEVIDDSHGESFHKNK